MIYISSFFHEIQYEFLSRYSTFRCFVTLALTAYANTLVMSYNRFNVIHIQLLKTVKFTIDGIIKQKNHKCQPKANCPAIVVRYIVVYYWGEKGESSEYKNCQTIFLQPSSFGNLAFANLFTITLNKFLL